MQYRLADENDLQQLKALGILAYDEFLPSLAAKDRAVLSNALHDESRLQDILERATTFVCVIEGTIVGMAYLIPKGNPTNIYPDDWAYIRMVGVNPKYRGLGIARQLMLQCIEHAQLTREHMLGLHTSEKMHAARHIYEALGFKIIKELDPIFGMRYWLYAMEIPR